MKRTLSLCWFMLVYAGVEQQSDTTLSDVKDATSKTYVASVSKRLR